MTESEFRQRVEMYAQDHYGKYNDLVRVAGDVCCFLFETFSFRRNGIAQRGLELHDALIAALDQVPGIDRPDEQNNQCPTYPDGRTDSEDPED